MTTSEGVRKTPEKLEAFARTEAERKWGTTAPSDSPAGYVSAGAVVGAEWGFLRAVELLQSEDAVNAAGRVLYVHWDEWDDDDLQAQGEKELVASALAAAVAAIPEAQNTNRNTRGGFA